MNEWEKYNMHRGHLERLTQTKKIIDNSIPLKPSFLKSRAKKEEMKRETQTKIDYENRMLYNKMHELKVKPSPYSQIKNLPSYCPAFDSSNTQHNKKVKMDIINRENKKLRKRFESAKPTYKTSKMIEESKYADYLKKNLAYKYRNTNLNFATYEKFRQNLKIEIERENVQMEDINNENNDNSQYYGINKSKTRSRPMSAQNSFNQLPRFPSNNSQPAFNNSIGENNSYYYNHYKGFNVSTGNTQNKELPMNYDANFTGESRTISAKNRPYSSGSCVGKKPKKNWTIKSYSTLENTNS